MHPVCGTCAKNGSICVYDEESRKDGATCREARGAQWPGQTQRTSEEEDPTGEHLEHLPADVQFGQIGSSDDKSSNMNGLVSRMDKVISAIEQLDAEGNQAAAIDTDNNGTEIAPMNYSKKRIQSVSSRPASPPSQPTAPVRGDEYPASSGDAVDLADSMENLDLGHLILEDDGRSRLVISQFITWTSLRLLMLG